MPHPLELVNVSLCVGSTLLLDTVNVHVSQGQRVAVVGPNGCGKSTLLRALAEPNEVSPYFSVSSGTILRNGTALLVEQDDLQWSNLFKEQLVDWDEQELRGMTIDEYLDVVSASPDDDVEAAILAADGWRRLRSAADHVLDWGSAQYGDVPIAKLSPGSAVRAYLAIALMRDTISVLLLDEPTNHLDMGSIVWLCNAVEACGKTVVFVSHDESFLDRVATHVFDVDPDSHSVTVSGAGYSAFRRAKEAAREQQRAAFESQQKRHKKLTEAANKLRTASSSGSQFKGTDKDKLQRDFKRDRAGRSGAKAKAFETRRDAEPAIEAVVDHTPLRIAFDPIGSGTDSSLILSEVLLGYDGVPLPNTWPVTFRADFGERVAIVGFNGAGKSTLLRTLTGEIAPIQGEATVGRDLRLGLLSQEHDAMPRDSTAREFLTSILEGPEHEHAGWRLLKFGLTKPQLDCPIRELNPGARARVLLAGFSMRKVNTLILDEPTNHLDDEAVAEVTSTLATFTGTLIVVSHNRAMLESLDFSRVYKLCAEGLVEVPSIRAFCDDIEERVNSVIADMHWK